MRYIKVFLLVIVFFFVMMFFVQNQASFADPVVLRMDLLFMPPKESIPLPLYSLMLICFALGALMVLLMLMWDRMAASSRLAGARRQAKSFEKQLQAAEKAAADDKEKMEAEQAKLQAEIAELEKSLAEARQAKVSVSALDALD